MEKLSKIIENESWLFEEERIDDKDYWDNEDVWYFSFHILSILSF